MGVSAILFGTGFGWVSASITVAFVVPLGAVLGGIVGCPFAPIVVICFHKDSSHWLAAAFILTTIMTNAASFVADMPLILLVAGGTLLWCAIAHRVLNPPPRSGEDVCICGHDLRGNVSGVCTECGRRIGAPAPGVPLRHKVYVAVVAAVLVVVVCSRVRHTLLIGYSQAELVAALGASDAMIVERAIARLSRNGDRPLIQATDQRKRRYPRPSSARADWHARFGRGGCTSGRPKRQ